ncbi:MAG: hypothetical protein NT056_04050 [Proteobacteria bacterium]|nr:hypothetical protein [Pseudomonadota bacterium]
MKVTRLIGVVAGAAFTASLFLAGCAGGPAKPDWIIKGSGAFPGDQGGALYGVGIAAKSPNIAMQRQKADSRARQELGRVINTYVASFMKDFMEEHQDFVDKEGSGSDEFTSIVSKTVSEATLVGSQIIDHFNDSDGTLYALGKLAVDDVLNQIKSKTQEALKEKKRAILEAKTNEMLNTLDDELKKKREAQNQGL